MMRTGSLWNWLFITIIVWSTCTGCAQTAGAECSSSSWHSSPPAGIIFNYQDTAVSPIVAEDPLILAQRSLNIYSTGDWSPYHSVTLYFAPLAQHENHSNEWSPNETLTACWHAHLTKLGTIPIRHGKFQWHGHYPRYVNPGTVVGGVNGQNYVVIASVHNGAYIVEGQLILDYGPGHGLH